MTILKLYTSQIGDVYLIYYCPGCKEQHSVPAKRWNWNNSTDKPTLSPSVRHFMPAREGRPEQTICHYHIQNGKIAYCTDCPHELAGKTIDMVEIKENE